MVRGENSELKILEVEYSKGERMARSKRVQVIGIETEKDCVMKKGVVCLVTKC